MDEGRFKPRTHSDPDLPQLIPLPVRPTTSYESRPQAKEHPQFSADIMGAMAKKLGLDVHEHADFRWVIRDCLLALRDDGWNVHLREGDLEYVHQSTEETRSFHEITDLHRQLCERLLLTDMELKSKRRDKSYQIKHLVFLAIMGEKDVRGVTTPKLIHEIVDLLEISIQDEPYLLHRVKTSVEDAYFRMQDVGQHRIQVENCIDVEALIVKLELDRALFMKKVSPSGLLYCVECSTSLGDIISAGCHDVFCNSCAVATHSTGHRQDHQMIFLEQTMCSECEQRAALVRCQDCVELFCYDCFKSCHARGKRQRHCVSLPQRSFCYECDEREATYLCMECEDVLCTKCCARVHRQGARQNHQLFGLRKAAYSKKLFAENLDRLMQIIQQNIDLSFPLSPWFIFYDSAFAPFWYNFASRYQERANPHDLVNPPIHVNEDDKGEGLSADEQMLRPLPGSTDLLDTQVARRAAEGACFTVPPPMHIKFASPASAAAVAPAAKTASEFKRDITGG